MRGLRLAVGAAGALACAALLALPTLRLVHRLREDGPVPRGARLSARLGCGACHLPRGGVEIPNPGSRLGTVPAFGNGSLRKYAKTRRAAEEIVRNGSPSKASGLTPVIFMPAYGGTLSEREIADLVSYVRAMEGEGDYGLEDPAAGMGWALASKHGCFSCHGPMGEGGVPNPGSLTGSVPGFLGTEYADLVRSRAELHEWIRTGLSTRVANRPLAMRFLEAQRISMPAFPKEVLSDDEMAAIETYITAARAARGR